MHPLTTGTGMAAFLIGAGAIQASAQSTAPIDRFAWVTGCWALHRGNTVIEEQWMAARGGTMVGMSRTTKDGRLLDYELLTVRAEGDRLTYEAHPSRQPMATFPEASSSDSTQVMFEDPGHDFPQRVGYRGLTPDSAVAWIEGIRNGKVQRIDFPYRRVSCPDR
jgi:hypothetical protein